MKNIARILFVALSIAFATSAFAQTTPQQGQTTPAPTGEVKPDKPKDDPKKKEQGKDAASSEQPAPAAQASIQTEVVFPLLRLLGIALILGLLLWWLDLPTLMRGETWTDRTVIALIIVFAFAAASLMNISPTALTALKDVTLIVVGFYFGAAKTQQAKTEQGTAQTVAKDGAQPQKDGKPATDKKEG